MEQPGKRIRKLQYGIVPTLPSLVVQVGTQTRFRDSKGAVVEYIISEIVENKDAFWDSGSCEFNIYISKDGKTENQLFWKRFAQRPDMIEFSFSEEDEEFLV